MNKLRSIFFPTIKEQITQYERLIQIHNEQIGYCSTCKHYIPTDPYLPGFITDYGKCELDKDIFTEKVCKLRDHDCDLYEESTEIVSHFESLINILKGE